MKANISEADVSLNAVHVAGGSASGRPALAQPVAAETKTDSILCSGCEKTEREAIGTTGKNPDSNTPVFGKVFMAPCRQGGCPDAAD
ncbi:MAG: hypothetical protein SOW30_12580 [Parabacteroides sp.]|nr:hypothetical protein [Parabacteroides sp.]